MNEYDDLMEQLEQCEADADVFCRRIYELESLASWLIGLSAELRDDRIGFHREEFVIPDYHRKLVAEMAER